MELIEKVKTAPLQSGCYLFKDSSGNVIYVGKAKILRNRVKQYFMEANQKDQKGFLLGKKICDVEFRITETERDALIEEYRLIKYFRPWFNRQHKSDKSTTYFIKLNRSGRYTSFEIAKQKEGKSQDYLGCFGSEGRAKEALLTLNKVFKIPVCNRCFHDKEERACLHYRVGQCMGPCGNKISPVSYEGVVDEMIAFFNGRQKRVITRLKKQMQEYAKHLDFEKASEIKNSMDHLVRLGSQFRHYVSIPKNRDMMLFFRAYREQGFTLFFIHNAGITGRCDFAQQIEPQKLKDFLDQKVVCGNDSNGDQVLADSLRYISADKLFVLLPGKSDARLIYSLVMKKYHEFMEE